MRFVYHLAFLIFSVFVLVKCVYYGVYEIRELNNRSGGIGVIAFAVLVVLFGNFVVWLY